MFEYDILGHVTLRDDDEDDDDDDDSNDNDNGNDDDDKNPNDDSIEKLLEFNFEFTSHRVHNEYRLDVRFDTI